MIEYATAKELAQSVADSEADELDPHESYVIVDEFSHEYPWGWIFEPVLEPYLSTGQPCPRTGAWCISVDRFSGKIQTSSWAGWRADQWPIVELLLIDPGTETTDVYRFLRELKGWSAVETRRQMATVPTVIATGPLTSLQPVAQSLSERGAAIELRQKHS
ncbi:hypothetical protein [Gimesia sp.]|uniref:hypothetical protein n=1 Tax=Gimesia sp. TaxID=2024833 RepID=UPI003A8D5E5D